MGRREQREQIFKLLFRVEFNTPEEMPNVFLLGRHTVLLGGQLYLLQKKLPLLGHLLRRIKFHAKKQLEYLLPLFTSSAKPVICGKGGSIWKKR